jgi:predicted transcriptional regulator
VLTLYRALTEARARLEASPSPTAEFTPDSSLLPSEEVGDFIQRRLNHFPELEEAAEELWRRCRLDADDVFYGLRRHLTDVLGVQLERSRLGGGVVRRYDPDRRVLSLSTALPPRTQTFALAHQVARLQYGDVLGRLSDDRGLTSEGSRALCRVALANYFAAAVMMPYTSFLDAATTLRYDIELLGHRFRSSFEQVCHRLTTLQRPGAEGVPFHLIRVDIAGNISKRFSASGIRFARFAGACPRWNVHTAFLTPGLIRTQLSRMTDGKVYFCVARTVRDDAGGYNAQHAIHAIAMGLEVSHARKLVYTDGIDLENLDTAVAIGTTCRQCDRVDCAQRAFPPVEHPLRIDENVRGVSFFAPVR